MAKDDLIRPYVIMVGTIAAFRIFTKIFDFSVPYGSPGSMGVFMFFGALFVFKFFASVGISLLSLYLLIDTYRSKLPNIYYLVPASVVIFPVIYSIIIMLTMDVEATFTSIYLSGLLMDFSFLLTGGLSLLVNVIQVGVSAFFYKRVYKK